MRNFFRKILGGNILKFRIMVLNFFKDFQLYYRHSNVFKVNNLNKVEAKLILDYHSLEKGMLFKEMKLGFGRDRVERIHTYLKDPHVINSLDRSQIIVAFQVMCKYYELHKNEEFDIEHFFSKNQYLSYKEIIKDYYSIGFNGAIDCAREDFYKDNNEKFEVFAHSRKSVRNFTGEIIDDSIIKKAVKLALTSPSVCNRQASKVYLLQDKNKIDKTLSIQGGFSGFSENVNQLLILTNDRNYYYTVGERNQFYIDGGIFLMNLLYSLHYYKIANCPANWGRTVAYEKKLSSIIDIPESEKIICMIPIGKAESEFRITLSKRKNLEEVLKYI